MTAHDDMRLTAAESMAQAIDELIAEWLSPDTHNDTFGQTLAREALAEWRAATERHGKLASARKIEPSSMRAWIERGTVRVVETGDENTYAVGDFDDWYFAKLDA